MSYHKIIRAGLSTAVLFFISARVQASPEVQVLSSEDTIVAPRWIAGQGTGPRPGNDVASKLAMVKWAQITGNRAKCVQLAHDAQAKAKSLAGWLTLIAIDCAAQMNLNVANSDLLQRTIDPVDKNPQWLLMGAQAPALRQSLIRASLALLEQDTKTNRVRAWKSVERLEELNAYMDNRTRAKTWKFAGELAFIQQKPEAARDFLRRSLSEFDDEETRQHLNAAEAALGSPNNTKESAVKPTAIVTNPALEASNEEIQLADRITLALKSGDFLPAVEDAMKMIATFPGSSRSRWATDRILEAYLSFGDRTEIKYQLLRDQFLKIMQLADADRLAEWARTFYNKGFFEESFAFAHKALETTTGVRRTKVLDLASDAALATEHFDMARLDCQDLVDHHAGTPQAKAALLRLGMLHYRAGQYGPVVADLERLLALPQIDKLELPARYWLWRGLQKQKSERADEAANELMQRFPFSYYGLRARFERNSHVLDWQPMKEASAVAHKVAAGGKVESRIWMTGPERVAWEKAQILLKAGWLDEAQNELKELPSPVAPEDKAVRSLYFAAAAGFVTASQMASSAWEDSPDLRRAPFTDAAYPREYGVFISKSADQRNIDRDIIRGLIRQESSYNVRAQSPSPAFGLMQIIGPTAREIALDLKLPAPSIPDDLFNAQTNIEMGTYYLGKMIAKYQGNVPLALAAYNAGPARIDRWLRTRASLKDLPVSRGGSFEDEMWFDEIPYSETSFYVKAILRNLLLYKMLEQGRVEIPEPVWAFHQDRAE